MKNRSYLLTGVTIVLFIAIIGFAYNYAVNSLYRISSQEAKRRIKSGEVDVILDVRTDLERSTLGFYPGSVHIQSADLDKEMPSRYPDKGIRIVSYCNTGHRARMATEKLHALGYKNSVYISSHYNTLQ